MITLPVFHTSQSADRSKFYGASDVASILGFPEAFKTAYELWAEKTRAVPHEDISNSPDIRRGNKLEAGILDLMASDLGAEHLPGPPVHEPAIINPDVSPYAGCHPDGFLLVPGEDVTGAEVKAPRKGSGWGDDGDEVPAHYWMQCQVCMALTGLRRWRLGALLYGEVRVFVLDYDEETTRQALATCDAWFAHYVLGGEEPPMDSTPAASAVYTRRIKGEVRAATDDEADAIRRYASLGAQIKALETEREAVKVALLTAANGARLEVGTGRAAWGIGLTANKGRTSVDATRLREEFPAAYAATAKVGNPFTTVRTFGIKES